MNKESKLNLNAGDYAISHCDSDKTYNGLEVHKMLCDAYIAGNNDAFDDEAYRKAYYDGYNKCNRDWIYSQEDEKIRHYLMNFVKINDGVNLPPDYAKKALAWLEKQAEQKAEENKGNIGGISANWSEEDGMILSCIVNNLKFIRDTLSRDAKYVVDVGSFEGQIEWLQSLQDRVQPQTKQEWSEEEEAVLDALIRRLKGEDIYVSPHLAVECIESIKGRVQPKQEWNEEDEQHIDSLLKRLDALCRNKFERTRFAISEDRDWLKSLRPQNRWKPSELQLGCLSDAIEHYNSLGYPAPKLKELLDDLKKLKECV